VTGIPTFTTHLVCSATGRRYPADVLHGLSEAGKPLLVRYDLESAGRTLIRETPAARHEGGLWRYRELLPARGLALAGAHLTLVDGLINDCGRRVAEGRKRMGWFDASTLKEPYRIEGKKTMGYEGAEHAEAWRDAHTIAAGIRVPAAIGDFLILRAVRESGGFAIAVDDAGIAAALASGQVGAHETAVLFNCASGPKYPLPPATAGA